jgi:hypothetical protein
MRGVASLDERRQFVVHVSGRSPEHRQDVDPRAGCGKRSDSVGQRGRRDLEKRDPDAYIGLQCFNSLREIAQRRTPLRVARTVREQHQAAGQQRSPRQRRD